jgi:hypothetical protein
MGMKKIRKLIEQEIDKAYGDGYVNGYESSYDAGVYDGIQAERKRVIDLFKMLSENELEHGSGNKAKFWKESADIVKIADEFEVFDEDGNRVEHPYFEEDF